jgi:predicted amidophosphoribosyltransferase
VTSCSRCQRKVEPTFRYCPHCAAPQRGKGLRVSRYLATDDGERHVRFSVWNREGVAQAAVSLDEDEAQRLGRFLLETAPDAQEATTAILHQTDH